MADIIEFGRKAQNLKSVKDTGLRQRKIEALKKFFQCTRCMMKCARCGSQLDKDADESLKYAAPYAFCRNCREEYEEFRERSSGKLSAPKFYWHNDIWMKGWESWLEHQKWMDEYRQSKEFMQLLEEVEELMRE